MRKLPLHSRVLLGLLLGAIAGAIAQAALGASHPGLKAAIDNFFKPVGGLFLNMIFMVVVPLIFSALVLGVAELGDVGKVGRIGLRSLVLTVILSGIAVAVGLFMVNTVRPGEGISAPERVRLTQLYGDKKKADEGVANAQKAKSAAETITELIPRNPLAAAVDGLGAGIISFMVFALIFGVALGSIEAEKALPVRAFLEGLFAVCQKIIEYAMALAPIGVFCLIFATAASLGVAAFLALGKYAATVLIALAIQFFLVYGLAIKYVARRSPVVFLRQIREVVLTAFATSSSNATLPTALRVAEEEVGLPRSISSFVLTVGATANQNGTALFEGITVLFLAQLFGVSLDIGQQAVVVGMCIVAGIGTAGVPGGSWPMIAVILMKVGIPAEAIGICLGVDRILDMSRTVLNVAGDVTIATCVAAMEERSGAGTPEAVAG